MNSSSTRRQVIQLLSIGAIGKAVGSGSIFDVSTQSSDGPTADFTYTPSSPTADETITFDASPSSDPDGSIEDYIWCVDGDYTAVEAQTYERSFETDGEYDVEVEVTDNGGNTDRASQTVTVGGQDPTAEFTYAPSSPTADETITFDASPSSDPDGSIEDYVWYVDGDYTAVVTQTYERSFETTGSMTWKLS